MLKKTFSTHQLIKISTTHMYIKLEVKKRYNSHDYNHVENYYVIVKE